jgi:Na+/H+ antiporter NhaD/arsenite permease-like protein
MKKRLWDFLVREWLMLAAGFSLVATSWYLGHLPLYTAREIEPIFLLFALFVVIKGIENTHLLRYLAGRMECGPFLSLRVVVLTFFLSMVVTIDVTLVTMLPLILTMNIKRKTDLAILVALTAHVGAALTPFGTPQNLFIYTWYDVELWEFIRVMAPFSFGLFLFFILASFFVGAESVRAHASSRGHVRRDGAVGYLILFALVVACVVGLMPVYTASLAILFALLFDRRSLRVDYALLLTFLFFIGLTANIREMIDGSLAHISQTFTLSAVMSQFISNVPTTLVLERFTDHWRSLLWGTNAGGFGSLVAALANLIAYKLFLNYGEKRELGRFTWRFVVAGYVTLMVAVGLHYLFFDYIHFFEE